MQNNTKTIGVQRGMKKNGTNKNTTAATHPLYNASHKHLKYLSTANDLQKELQVSHPLLGQRDKSVKRVKSGRTSTQSTLHRDNVHTSASQNESACEWETVKKWEDKARQNITSVLRANTHRKRMFRMHVTHWYHSSTIYYNHNIFDIIIYCLFICKPLCLWEKKRVLGGLREGVGRGYASIKQTGAV